MKKLLKDKSFRLSVILTTLFLGTGITFLLFGLVQYGWALFILLPIVLGIAIGAMPNKKYVIGGAIITTIIVLICMYIPGMSGLLCIVMALPLIIPPIFIGYIISFFIKKYRELNDTDNLKVLLLPLIPFFIGIPIENNINENPTTINEVKTEQVFNYSSQQVYDAIKSVDTLDAPKPYLMYFDLPIPVKCILQDEKVGGIRTCYFKSGKASQRDFGSGTITERITELTPAKVLKMDVIDYKVVGRNWLGFKNAIYYFDSLAPNKCKLTRITTYTSVLAPRFYWEPLEKLGINQEHDYVFANLAKDLNKKFGLKHSQF